MYLIPLSSEPLQTQNFTHDGYDLTLTTRWNTIFGIWQFDLFDNIKQEYIVQSAAFTISSPSLMGSVLPFYFVMIDDAGLINELITKEDLGNRVNVYIVNKDEYRAAVRQSLSVNYR